MTQKLVPGAAGDPRNARYLAIACDLAYLSGDAGLQAYRDKLGLDGTFCSVDNTQVYVVGDDENIVLAFRGSESPTSIDGLKDWLLTNAVNLLVLPEGTIGSDFAAAGVGARFHQGFLGALAEIWPPLLANVEAEVAKKERNLWVTGHSLGGALATLASWRLYRKFVDIHQIYTYGAPMVGNQLAMDAYNREFAGRIFRYVNTRDFVPRLPTVSLIANQYMHCDKVIDISDPNAGTAASEELNSFGKTVVDGLLSGTIIDNLWAMVKNRIDAHDIVNYGKWIA